MAAHLEVMQPRDYKYLLTARRIMEAFNSSFHGHTRTMRRHGTNKIYIHPADMAAIGASDDDALRVRSPHGELVGYVKSDATMKPGVVSMSHGWGAATTIQDPLFLQGAHTGRLISMNLDIQSINRMPLQSGVAVAIERLPFTLHQAKQGSAALMN